MEPLRTTHRRRELPRKQLGGGPAPRTLLVGVLVAVASLACAGTVRPPGRPTGNLVANADFQQPGEGVPAGWIHEDRVKHKGEVAVADRGDGRAAVLRPNARNVEAEWVESPLAIGQVLDLEKRPELRGATMHVSVEMGARGGATAVVRLTAIRRGNEFIGTTLKQGSSAGELVEHQDALILPSDDRTLFVVLGLEVHGTAGEAVFDDVYLGTVPRPAPSSGAAAAAPLSPARIEVDAGQRVRTVPETLYGVNLEWIWDGNGIWDAARGALDPELVRLTRELRPTLMRFPGGIFADFYHWRDGTGPRAERPPRPHMPGGPSSPNDFGTDEALEFARRTGGELMITVNVATGTPEEAVAWLRYVNRPEQTRGEAPAVRYWEIGNENYYEGEAPYLKKGALDAKTYVRRVREFARALRAADSRIRVLAVAEENYEAGFEPVHPDWLRLLLSQAGPEIDFVAVHNGYAPRLEQDLGWDLRTVYGAMLASPLQLRKSLDRVAAAIREHAPGRHASRIKIAVTEWGPYFQTDLKGRFLDHPKTLGSALFTASTLLLYAEHPEVEIANYFKLTGRLWQGMIGLRGEGFAPKAPYLAFRFLREHLGPVLVRSRVESPTFRSRSAGSVPALRDVPYLDVASSLSADGSRLFLVVVNKSLDQPIEARISLEGFVPGSGGRAFVLTGTGIDAHTGTELFRAPGVEWAPQASDDANPRFGRGGPGEVGVSERAVDARAPSFVYTFARHSLSAIELRRSGS